MIKEAEQSAEASTKTELIMILNWFEELKERVPVP
jgi:hypothetical protein